MISARDVRAVEGYQGQAERLGLYRQQPVPQAPGVSDVDDEQQPVAAPLPKQDGKLPPGIALLRLSITIVTPDTQVAAFTNDLTGATLHVQAGNRVDRLTVTSIEASAVTLTGTDGRVYHRSVGVRGDRDSMIVVRSSSGAGAPWPGLDLKPIE